MTNDREPRHLRLAASRRLSLIDGSALDGVGLGFPADGQPRPAFTSIDVQLDGDRVTATTVLALKGRVLMGSYAGDASDRVWVVASATLAAIAPLLDFEASVDSATIIDVGGHDIAMTILRSSTAQSESESLVADSELLVGSALLRGDAEDATARSVLSALNRSLG